MKDVEIKIFKARILKDCIHSTAKNCKNKNVMAVEFLSGPARIEFFCEGCIKRLRKMYKH